MQPVIYQRIASNRERILSLWQAAALPQGRILPCDGTSGSRFSAPAEHLLKEQTEVLLDWLINEEEPAEARFSLQEICRLKAVQATNPSEALSFLFDIKGIVRLVVCQPDFPDKCTAEFDEMDKRVDQLMLLAFDEYLACREQILEIKSEEVRRLTGKNAR